MRKPSRFPHYLWGIHQTPVLNVVLWWYASRLLLPTFCARSLSIISALYQTPQVIASSPKLLSVLTCHPWNTCWRDNDYLYYLSFQAQHFYLNNFSWMFISTQIQFWETCSFSNNSKSFEKLPFCMVGYGKCRSQHMYGGWKKSCIFGSLLHMGPLDQIQAFGVGSKCIYYWSISLNQGPIFFHSCCLLCLQATFDGPMFLPIDVISCCH